MFRMNNKKITKIYKKIKNLFEVNYQKTKLKTS